MSNGIERNIPGWANWHQEHPLTLRQLPTLRANINHVRKEWEQTQDISKLMHLYFLQFAERSLDDYSKTAKKDPWGRAKGDIKIRPRDWLLWMTMSGL